MEAKTGPLPRLLPLAAVIKRSPISFEVPITLVGLTALSELVKITVSTSLEQAGEGYCSAYCKTFGVETVVLRFGNVYGPGSAHKNSVIAKFIKQAQNNEVLEIFGDGNQTRDFIYVKDLIDAVMLAAEVPDVGGETFQIASNQETSLAVITQKLIQELKHFGIVNIKVVNSEARLGDVKRNYSDTNKAKAKLGWKCVTSQQQGLQKTVEYFLK